MFIVVKNDLIKDKKEVANIIYGDNYDTWVTDYLKELVCDIITSNKKESDNHDNNDIKLSNGNISYYSDITKLSIIKKEEIIEKGYLFNNKKTKETQIIKLDILEYNPRSLDFNKNKSDCGLWDNLNSEISRRVLKNMDKDSLYQVFVELDNNMKLKQNWTSNDFINILNELLKNFKKQYYSSIAKKLKRYKSSSI